MTHAARPPREVAGVDAARGLRGAAWEYAVIAAVRAENEQHDSALV